MQNKQIKRANVEAFYEKVKRIDIESVPYFKKGGKTSKLMEKGGKSGIHIKKENRGKFTDYCGGKVTSECISKGKNSPNAAIRKRATFAANARKWNHEDGGTLKPRAKKENKWNFKRKK